MDDEYLPEWPLAHNNLEDSHDIYLLWSERMMERPADEVLVKLRVNLLMR